MDSSIKKISRGELKLDQQNPLPNKLRQLRKENNLTIQALADQLKCSHAFIYFLEQGKRGASDETLQKYAKFFNYDFNEMKELQKVKIIVTDQGIKNTPINPDYLEEYNLLIMKFSDDFRLQYVTEQIENLRKRFYNSLNAYDLGEIKKLINKIKRSWYTFQNEEEPIESKVFQGTLQIPEKQMYFTLDVSEHTCSLQLLYEDHRHVDLLKTWLGEENVSLLCTEEVTYLEEKQKFKKYIWFSPSISIKKQLSYLIDKKLPLDKMIYRDHQLHIAIKYYLENNTNIESPGF